MSNPLKVLIVPSPPPHGVIENGQDRYLDALLQGMGGRVVYTGIDDPQYARGPDKKWEPDPHAQAPLPRSRITRLIPRNIRLLIGYLRDAWRLSRVLRPYRNQVSLIHVNRVGCEIQPIAARLAGFTRVVTSIHNLPGDAEKDNWVCRLVEWLSFACGDLHIAVSEATRQAWQNRVRLKDSKCVVIHNGMNPRDLSGFDRRAYRRQFCEDPDHTIIIGICARLHKMKGHEVLLEAFASLLKERLLSCRGVELLSKSPVVSLISTTKQPNNPTTIPLLLIAGAGPERLNIEAKIAELGIGDYVRLLGHRSDAEQFAASLDLNVLPSVSLETLGYSVVEAMFAGVPSVVSDVGGMREVIAPPGAGTVVRARDVEGLKKAMLQYVNDPLRIEKEGQAARGFAEKNLTAKHMAAATYSVYELMVASLGGQHAAVAGGALKM